MTCSQTLAASRELVADSIRHQLLPFGKALLFAVRAGDSASGVCERVETMRTRALLLLDMRMTHSWQDEHFRRADDLFGRASSGALEYRKWLLRAVEGMCTAASSPFSVSAPQRLLPIPSFVSSADGGQEPDMGASKAASVASLLSLMDGLGAQEYGLAAGKSIARGCAALLPGETPSAPPPPKEIGRRLLRPIKSSDVNNTA